MRNHTHGIQVFVNRKAMWLELEKWAYKFILTENVLLHKKLVKDL